MEVCTPLLTADTTVMRPLEASCVVSHDKPAARAGRLTLLKALAMLPA